MIPENKDLALEATALVPIQFYDKPNFNALLTEYVNQQQIGNDTIFQILDGLSVEAATGYLLDCVGSYVAVLRNADDDDTFRERIKRRILISSSEGTPNELLTLLATITEGSDVSIWNHFPVSASFSTNGKVVPAGLAEYMREASPATSGDVIVYLNPFENCTIPSELGFQVLKLADKSLTPFGTGDAETIVVNDLIYGGEEDQFAVLSEFTYGIDNGTESHTTDGKGILCEIAFTNGGVNAFNFEYLELDNSILEWGYQMNVATPNDFE